MKQLDLFRHSADVDTGIALAGKRELPEHFVTCKGCKKSYSKLKNTQGAICPYCTTSYWEDDN